MPVDGEPNPNDVHVSRIAVKLPPLWKNNIKLWFVQAESNFELSGITADQTKYNNIIAAIDPETLSAVSDILLNPPASDKYDTLKNRLIAEFSDSENRQIRKLLSELHLGDDKPSHFLRKMRELAGTSLNDDFLKTLWLQRLPSEIQTILSVSSEPLENLAKLADKIAEVRADPLINVCAVNNAVSSNLRASSRSDSSNPLYHEVVTLRQEIAALSQQFQRFSRENPRDRSRKRYTKSPIRRITSRSRERKNTSGFCYFHSKFGQEARKCHQPCSFNTNQEN